MPRKKEVAVWLCQPGRVDVLWWEARLTADDQERRE